MHLQPLPGAWVARAAAAWVVGLGVVGVAGAVAHEAPREQTVRVEGAVFGEDPGAATDEAQASTTVASSAPETPATFPGSLTPPWPSPPPSTSEVTTAPPASLHPTTTTRAPQPTTSVPSPSPYPWTTIAAPTTATYFVTNSTASTAVVVINDVTHRVLPDQSVGPFTTSPRGIGEAGGDEVVLSLADDPTCGVADSDRFFRPGSIFDVHIFESPGFCLGLATAHAPSFTITSRLPTTG